MAISKPKRAAAAFLALFAFFLFCCGPLAQSAEALAVEGSLIAVIIAALAAMGITIVATQGYDNLESYVDSLLSSYASSRGLSVGELFSGVQVGSNSLGKLLLNNRFVILINGFAAWLKAEFNLIDNNTQTIYNSNVVALQHGNSFPIYEVNERTHARPQGSWWSNSLNYSNTEGLQVYSEDNWWEFATGYKLRVWFYGDNPDNGSWRIRMYNASDVAIGAEVSWSGTLYDNLKFVFEHNTTDYYWNHWLLASVKPDSEHTGQGPMYFNDQTFQDYFLTGMSVNTGTIMLPSDDPAYTDGDGAVIDVGVGWGSSYGDIIDGIEGSIESTGEVDASITYDSEDVVSEQVEDTPSQVISSDASDYQVIGLQSVFPFCIPFDLYNFVSCLAADPVAPSFEWRFYVPGIVDETIEIDLAPYDSVAQLLRTMELLLFCVGLAFVTRKIIRG